MMQKDCEYSGPCPCGGASFESCCKPYLDGLEIAPDAKALMRSRYTAFVMRNEQYLRDTWIAANCPSGNIIDKKLQTKWLGLTVLGHEQQDDRATVEFIARYKINGRMHKLHELSRFIREDGRWYYFDGTFF